MNGRAFSFSAISLLAISSGCRGKAEPESSAPPPSATTSAAARVPSGAASATPSKKPGLSGLTAVEILTDNAPAEDILPMIVALHDEHTRAETIASLFAHQEAKARLLAFRAPTPKSDTAAQWFPTLEEVKGDTDAYAKGIREVTERLAFTLTEARKKRSTWGKPIVVGISQGGDVALQLALTHPEHASVVFVAGSILPAPLWPQKRDVDANYPKINFMQTSEDEIVPFGDVQKLQEKLRGMGFPVRLQRFVGPHEYTFAIRLKVHDQLQEAIQEVRTGDRFAK